MAFASILTGPDAFGMRHTRDWSCDGDNIGFHFRLVHFAEGSSSVMKFFSQSFVYE